MSITDECFRHYRITPAPTLLARQSSTPIAQKTESLTFFPVDDDDYDPLEEAGNLMLAKWDEGEAEGMKKGKTEDRVEGKSEGLRTFVLNVLRARFGDCNGLSRTVSCVAGWCLGQLSRPMLLKYPPPLPPRLWTRPLRVS